MINIIDSKIYEFISKYRHSPNQIIMNENDFIDFIKYFEGFCEKIDIKVNIKYRGISVIRTSNIESGKIKVGLFI